MNRNSPRASLRANSTSSSGARPPVDLGWLPAGYVQSLPRTKTEALAAELGRWIASDAGLAPRIEYVRGVVFAESDEDRGDDGPYPRSAVAEGGRICGTQAIWLRAALREALRHAELACWHNACRYPGMEYAPTGIVVFRELADGSGWALDAWIEVYEATLGPDVVAKNYRDVTATLKRAHASRCPREPAGTY